MQEKLKNHINSIIALTDEEFSTVYSFFTSEKYLKNEFLCNEGDAKVNTYFVISGLLKLNYTDNSGKIHIVSFAMEDWWESDFQAFFKQSKATMSLQCLEDTSVLCISLENYYKMCSDVPKMQIFLIKMSNSGFVASQQRILSLLTSNAKQRYEQLLQQQPSLFQRLPKSQLALYLGVSRETLSRLSS
jgi:CRP-like cAMP-binding protein